MSGLCKYKDALGKPGEGVHEWRVLKSETFPKGLAGADLLMTAAAAALLTWGGAFRGASGGNVLIAFLIVFIILMVVAIGLHRAFCVNTALNQTLDLSSKRS